MKITNANQLAAYAVKVFTKLGYVCWRQNNVAVCDKGQFRRFVGLRGVSDVIGFHAKKGRFLAVEIKVGRDRLSPEQEKFLDAVNRAGGVGVVVRHADDLKPYLENHE
jgi:hypothetical protein